jgi:hypothetical protein
LECELAAAAIVEELGFPHYEGNYTQDSHFEFTGDPLPGTILKFANLAPDMPTDLDCELITAVKSTIESSAYDAITHEVTFGNPDRLKKLLAGFQRPVGAVAREDTAEIPSAADLAAATTQIGALNSLWYPVVNAYSNFGTLTFVPSTHLESVVSPHLLSWENNYPIPADSFYTIEFDQAPPAGGGFEVRYTDRGWGDINNRNLITQTAAATFELPKRHGPNGDFCFIRAYDGDGLYSRYSAALRIWFPKLPPRSNGITPVGGTLQAPVYKVELPTNADGTPNLNSSIYGVEVSYANQMPVAGWFPSSQVDTLITQNVSTPIGADNPGQYNVWAQNPTGLTYGVNDLVLPGKDNALFPGNTDARYSGFISYAPDIPIEPVTVSKGWTATFFVWVRAIAFLPGDMLRLNIKDNFAPGLSAVPYGFYSRSDNVLTGDWQPLFTRASFSEAVTGLFSGEIPNYGLVIHNINDTEITLRVALPFLCLSFYNQADIVLGASPDSPGLQFTYDNSGA